MGVNKKSDVRKSIEKSNKPQPKHKSKPLKFKTPKKRTTGVHKKIN
jgi:hypothetical protein